MNPVSLIARKRDGEALSQSDIREFIRAYADGSVPDYQMAAMAMAIFLRGMDATETASLTEAMLDSGTTLNWPTDERPVVDKHSTGGVGDKVSLILAPLLACCGCRVPMISGRGLGPTGGTLDKLEAIPGLRTDLSIDEIRDITQRVGCVITGATEEIAPADRKLYALRDVTATVPSIPLITASIMSKKLAAGLSALVLDVKFGSGAFMKTMDDARRLARSLVDTGERMGVKTTALLTDMNQPLGRTAGNAIEVQESIETLKGNGPADFVELTIALSAELLVLGGVAVDDTSASSRLRDELDSGRALGKLYEMVRAQGGDAEAKLALASSCDVAADRSGFIKAIDTEALGWAVIELGGGRKKVTDAIDHSVGLELFVRLGDEIERGQPLVRVYSRGDSQPVKQMIQNAFTIGEDRPAELPLIAECVEATP